MKPFAPKRDWIKTVEGLIKYEFESGILDKVSSTKFAPESAVIADLMTRKELDTYIDLSCWYGLLLEQVL